ncbi:hypothetical protein LX36DRAFT_379991 [Colletotrichum falcatum]|nr:hypothetical protein LX36DRAFT_379991 [Colletotrichum falcatum]
MNRAVSRTATVRKPSKAHCLIFLGDRCSSSSRISTRANPDSHAHTTSRDQKEEEGQEEEEEERRRRTRTRRCAKGLSRGCPLTTETNDCTHSDTTFSLTDLTLTFPDAAGAHG